MEEIESEVNSVNCLIFSSYSLIVLVLRHHEHGALSAQRFVENNNNNNKNLVLSFSVRRNVIINTTVLSRHVL